MNQPESDYLTPNPLLPQSNLWDIAGVDGLHVAKSLFGNAVDRLAPFQSLETELQGQACSILRLCDRNFRIVYPGPLDQFEVFLNHKVWIKQFTWLGAISLPIGLLPKLIAQATVRPPHRLAALPNHRAVPAEIDSIAILIWRHPRQGQPVLEIHTAHTDLDRLIERLTYSPS
jgi:hypothetical protein